MAGPFDRFRGSGGRRAAGSGGGRPPAKKAGAKPSAGQSAGGDSWFRPSAADPDATTVVAPPPTKRERRKRRLLRALWAGLAAVFVMFLMAFVAYARTEIPPANANVLRQTTQVYYLDDDKNPFARYGDTNRKIVPLSSMPTHLRDAVIAAENRGFYTDSGVSPKGITRALWVNLRGGATQGGSTITQQYVKNYYLTSERSIQRKLKEALLSIKIDKEKSKDQILEDYLNTIYLGRGAYGVAAAANAYFNVEVNNLTLSQSAVLASIVRSPGNYDPSSKSDLERLKGRWAYVLDSMVETGTLGPELRAKQKFPKFPAQAKDATRFGGQKGYLLGAISKELQARGLTKDQIENGGLRIRTTLDRKAQDAAVAAVEQEFPKTANKGLRVGLAAVEPGTGRIVAMYGGKDFLGKDRYAQVNAATYPIQPGSQMKVFAIAAGLEDGDTLATRYISKSPLRLPGTTNGKPNSVRNEFNMSYGDTQDLMYGLQESINTVFVDLTLKHGPQKVRDAMVRAGIPNDAPGFFDNALMPLGILSLTPVQVANSYATLCSGGIRAQTHIVEEVRGPNGGLLPDLAKLPKPTTEVYDPAVVSDVLRAMQNVVTNGTGQKARALGRPAAGKTGTHQDLTAWFSGCTPQLVAAVDYFRNAGTDSLDGAGGLPTFFGGRFPAQTWTTFMKGALAGKPVENFKLAPGLTPTATPTPTPIDTAPATVEPTPDPTGLPGFPNFPGFPFPEDTPSSQPSGSPTDEATDEPTDEPDPDPDEEPAEEFDPPGRPIFREEQPAARPGGGGAGE
ncbi:MAG: transglycosylase domain-containing protein [Sporichthyaceae bacterium]